MGASSACPSPVRRPARSSPRPRSRCGSRRPSRMSPRRSTRTPRSRRRSARPRSSRSEDRSTQRDSVRSLLPVARPLLYVVAGGLVGFLLLTEFALITFPVVQIALLGLAVFALIGALRRRVGLGLWSL